MNYIIYHADCTDGWASKTIAEVGLTKRDEEFESIPGAYQYELPTGKFCKSDTVYFVDFSVKREEMIRIAMMVRKVVVIDHHESALKDLSGIEKDVPNVTLVMDMTQSGAGLTYKHFIDAEGELPYLIKHIQSSDIYTFEPDDDTDAIQLYFKSIPHDDDWPHIFGTEDCEVSKSVLAQGRSLVRFRNKLAASLMKHIDEDHGESISELNCVPREIVSYTLNRVCREAARRTGNSNQIAINKSPVKDDHLILSVRAIGKIDLSIILPMFGGGGHKHAGGCKVSTEQYVKLVGALMGQAATVSATVL